MTKRSSWVLAWAALATIGCAVAAAFPNRGFGVVAVVPGAAATTVLLWMVGGGDDPRLRGWRRLAVSLVLPALGGVLRTVLPPMTGQQMAVLRWLTIVPGYLIATAAIVSLVRSDRLRAGCLRVGIELALFASACATTVALLLIGPDGRWAALSVVGRLVLGAAVVVTSAAMAAALTVLGSVPASRQRMALALLGGMALLSAGCGLSTLGMATARTGAVDASRFCLVLGLALLALAALIDPGSRAEARSGGGRSTELGQVLPHVAMVVAVGATAGATVLGHRPATLPFAGAVLCVALAAVHRWLTARAAELMAERLRRSEAWFRSLVHSGSDAVVILDEDLRVATASPALDRVLGPAAAAALVGRRLLGAVHPEDVAGLGAVLPAAPGDGPVPPGPVLLRLRGADGTWRFLEAAVTDLREHADVGAFALHCRDMTERNAREEALAGVAYTDPMTGLPNRAGWLRALEALNAAGEPAPGALLLVELEGLIEVREQAGRDVVTTLVAEVGRRLRRAVRAEDMVARLGGGGFAILAAGSPAEADRLADRCLAVVERPIATPTGILEATASVGVVAIAAGVGVDELRRRAELAVRAARAAGPGSAARYTPALGAAAARRDRIREELVGAAERGELSLAFQPVVSLEEQRITGIEALLRWQHPALGQVPPAEFMPIAEAAGLVSELQRWVLREAALAAVSLPAAEPPLRLGVNVSAAYLAGGTAVADVEATLRSTGLTAERLILELPEAAALVEQQSVALDVATLRLMGVHVALDDFGTGPSALGSLTRLPWDVLKLDVSLVARIDRDPQVRALCTSVVGIGRALGLDVVAEGVETPAQLAALCAAGCGFAQGFLIGRPTSFAEFSALNRDGAGALWPGLVASR